ncbi:MAG: HpcH/HpaI aldolase/citrate lyase family protein [Anaerolineae bacterium]
MTTKDTQPGNSFSKVSSPSSVVNNPHPFLENKVKRALDRGEAVIGSMATEMRSPAIAQILAAAGFDFIIIDMEHGTYNLETVAGIIRVARLCGICPIVRVPDPLYHLMSAPLDAGAQGLMIPRVESREVVEGIVQSVKYPPQGLRGCSTVRGHTDYRSVEVKEFLQFANEETLLVIQIERRRAVEEIEALLSVEGVDVALIGPRDLSISLGVPGESKHPIMMESTQKVVDTCRKYGVTSAIHTGDLEILKYWRDRGMRFLSYSSEVAMISSMGSQAVAELRSLSPTNS